MHLFLLLPLVAYVSATVIDHGSITAAPTPTAVAKRQAASLTATVTLSSSLGTPSHLASGFIYGIPDTANQIADSFYTQMVSSLLMDSTLDLCSTILIPGLQFCSSRWSPGCGAWKGVDLGSAAFRLFFTASDSLSVQVSRSTR